MEFKLGELFCGPGGIAWGATNADIKNDKFKITVKSVEVRGGAEFIVVKTGKVMTMPGLPKVPAAERIDVDENGKISGLF